VFWAWLRRNNRSPTARAGPRDINERAVHEPVLPTEPRPSQRPRRPSESRPALPADRGLVRAWARPADGGRRRLGFGSPEARDKEAGGRGRTGRLPGPAGGAGGGGPAGCREAAAAAGRRGGARQGLAREAPPCDSEGRAQACYLPPRAQASVLVFTLLGAATGLSPALQTPAASGIVRFRFRSES
jgi:hypothetical protein